MGLERADPPTSAGKIYALQIADTVVISPGKTSAEVATAEAPKSWGDVAWLLSVSLLLSLAFWAKVSGLGLLHPRTLVSEPWP